MSILTALFILAQDPDYEKLRKELRLKNKSWASIPWQASVTEARELAAKTKRPIFMMVDTGNPIGFA